MQRLWGTALKAGFRRARPGSNGGSGPVNVTAAGATRGFRATAAALGGPRIGKAPLYNWKQKRILQQMEDAAAAKSQTQGDTKPDEDVFKLPPGADASDNVYIYPQKSLDADAEADASLAAWKAKRKMIQRDKLFGKPLPHEGTQGFTAKPLVHGKRS